MVLGIQLIGVVFLIFMLYLTFLYYKKNTYTRTGFIFWTCIWVGGSVLLIFPETVQGITEQLEFARTSDLYFTIALMFFGAITFLNYANVKRQERKVEDLVRSAALRKRK
jgi:hypothetical protein